MFFRLVADSFGRRPRHKLLTGAALALGMGVATATLSVALEVGDRLAKEFRSLGANLVVTPKADSLPLEIGGVDYRPVKDRKSTRLNSSHSQISYAVFCLKKKHNSHRKQIPPGVLQSYRLGVAAQQRQLHNVGALVVLDHVPGLTFEHVKYSTSRRPRLTL